MEKDQRPVGTSNSLACIPSREIKDWFIPVNPSNQNVTPEGDWEEWVELAHAILAHATLERTEEERRNAEQNTP